MVQAASQQITVAFDTEEAFTQGQQRLLQEDLATAKIGIVSPRSETTPATKRSIKPGGWKAAGIGGVMGAIATGAIILTGLNVPNVPSVATNAAPLLVLGVIIGTAFGGVAGGLSSFFAGAKLDQDPSDYRLSIEASPEDIKTATALLLEGGGRLI